jgi:GT2 family glycosyltransferase
MASTTQISICVLAGHRAELLEACLAGLRSQVEAPAFELLIGGNPTTEEVAAIHRQFPDARVFDTGRRLPGGARNPLIERARGELLLFLDDDVIVPPELLRRLADTAAAHPEASVFGGPNGTPPSSSRFERVQGAALSSLLGSGPVSRRYGARHRGFADERWFTLCNLAVRRRVMRPFADELVCAEENALLAELRRAGEPMLYEPALRVFHARRPSWGSFARQMVKYGRGRGQLVRREPATARAAYLAPAALLLYLLALPALLAGLGATLFMLAPLMLYAVLIGTTSIRIAWSLRRAGDAPLALALIITIHACYGAGVIRGIVLPGPAARVAAAKETQVAPRAPAATPLVVIEATPPSSGTQ